MAYADVSLASTSVANPVFGAPTTFNFSSGNDGGYASSGANDQSARNSESATAALGSANSATAAGGSPSVLTPSAVTGASGFLANLPLSAIYIGGGVVALLLVGLIFLAARK